MASNSSSPIALRNTQALMSPDNEPIGSPCVDDDNAVARGAFRAKMTSTDSNLEPIGKFDRTVDGKLTDIGTGVSRDRKRHGR